jgi:hypothetical protein
MRKDAGASAAHGYLNPNASALRRRTHCATQAVCEGGYAEKGVCVAPLFSGY